MPLEHLGLAVPDVDAARTYFDEFMPMVGFQHCFGNGHCPEGFEGTQLFLCEASEAHGYSRHATGLQHLAFFVPTRGDVNRAHEWARDRGDEIVRAPKPFPRYGPDCYASFFLDPHGFMIEVVTHNPDPAS